MLQILWERGFIDSNKSVRDYSTNGKKSHKDSNKIIPGSSLKELIQNLPDFKEELTLLQFRAQQLGVQVCCSPKYHPEIAGEDVEFCWAMSKNAYRKYQLKVKRTKEKFVRLVDKCQEGITKKIVRVFGRQMRHYILAYHGIETAKEEEASTGALVHKDKNGSSLHLPEMSLALVEQMIKKKKSHRNIADSLEKKFLNSILLGMKQATKNLN